MATRNYAELSTRSCFSFLKAASQPEELISEASLHGYRAMALTDHHGFYGMVRAYHQAKLTGLHFIAGTEIKLEQASLIFLARTLKGYRGLCRVLSEGFREREKGSPLFVRKYFEDFLEPSEVHLLLPPRDFPKDSLLRWIRENFDPTQLITKGFHPDRDQKLKNWLRELSPEIPRAWTWDAYFHQASRHELYEVIRAIDENTPIEKKLPSANGEAFLKPLHLLDEYQVPKSWTQKTIEIAESCEFSPSEIRYYYPQEWLPEGKTSIEFLKELCEKGLWKRYHGNISREVAKQLAHELKLIEELEYADYFLTIWDIVNFARSQNILCQGRGSAANSIVCYLLEITAIDPVRMNLLFERFISKERDEAPDIDVDFEHERREEVIQYVYNKYGRHRAGMVATLITYRKRSALRDIGKALGISNTQLDEASKRSRWREDVISELKDSSDPLQKRWGRLANEIKGFPRHLGQHTGGMILTHDRLDEISPIEPASMKDRSVVQWDKYDIEKLGLLKVDLLGLGMLTCLRKTMAYVNEFYSKNLELHTIPPNDKRTFEMIQQADTVGVFQIESRAQMSMLPRLKPKNFYDLVIEVAIVRPGPIQGGMVHPYLRRRMGLEKVTYAHPKLKPILEKTLGVPIFQEQVMKIAIEVAGYGPGEADQLRRAMGAWKKSGDLRPYAEELKKRMHANGVPEIFCAQIAEQVLGFGEYGFPESHAASFALLTYSSAYLKANYPAAYLCGLLNSMPMGFYSMHALTANFQREGVSIQPLSLEKSVWDHQLEKDSSGNIHLRLGFRCVKGLRKASVLEFLESRKQTGKIEMYLFDVAERASIAMAAESTKKRSDYWKALGPHRDGLELQNKEASRFPQLRALESMLLDFEFTQTSLDHHPAKLFREQYWSYSIPREKLTSVKDLASRKNKESLFVFGMIQVVQSPPTAKGMVFITLEDEDGFYNLVLQPPVFKRFKPLIQNQLILLVRGELQNQSGAISILVKQIFTPQNATQLHSLRSANSCKEYKLDSKTASKNLKKVPPKNKSYFFKREF